MLDMPDDDSSCLLMVQVETSPKQVRWGRQFIECNNTILAERYHIRLGDITRRKDTQNALIEI